MLSKEEKALKKLAETFKNKGSIFLDKEVNMCSIGQRTALLSIPRMGSSFSWKLLERVTGIYTGDDMDLYLPVLFGFAGTRRIDDSIWLMKSHYPERTNSYESIPINKAVIV